MLLDTICLRPVPLTFESPVWLVLLNRFMTQRASWPLNLVVQKRVAGTSDCWPIFLSKTGNRVQFMMMETEKVSETSDLQSEVMGGRRWRSPGKIIQCYNHYST